MNISNDTTDLIDQSAIADAVSTAYKVLILLTIGQPHFEVQALKAKFNKK